jgi:hypothetical protein
MSDVKVQDNFLEESQFKTIRDYILDYNNTAPGQSINWFMSDLVKPGDSQGLDFTQFVHIVYAYGETYSQVQQQLNVPGGFLEKIDPYTVERIKINLITKQPKVIETGMHVDCPHAPDVALTSIFYLNTNNGYTAFETGEKVKSVANRLVTFPNNKKHAGTSCSDEVYRCVLNIDYIKNKRTA